MNKPNVVIILADDMGYGDIGCFNKDTLIPTFNMDRLADTGLKFTDAHSASAVCTPSRYGIITGRYCWRTNLHSRVFYGYEPPLIEKDRMTIAKMFKKSGYNTACIGKWHLGLNFTAKENESIDFNIPLPWPSHTKREFEEKIDFSVPITGGPVDLGFDYFYGTSGCSTCQPPFGYILNDTFITKPCIYRDIPLPTSRPGMSSSDWCDKDVDVNFSQKAVQYIEQQAKSENPFFLYLSTSTPHEPCIESVVPEFARGKSKAGPRGDMVWLFDWVVGQVKDALEKAGLLNNTLIIVTSDNGALPGDRTMNSSGEWEWHTYGHKSCGDYLGYKSHIWEGGHREPMIISWPGKIKQGSTSDEFICLTDIMATCGSIINEELTNYEAEDSFDFLPIILGENPDTPIRDTMIHHSGYGVFSIRQGEWKMVFESQGSGGWPPPVGTGPEKGKKGQLFNIKQDPYEKYDLWDECPDITEKMTKLLIQQINSNRTAPDR